jgi:hypothetical protein
VLEIGSRPAPLRVGDYRRRVPRCDHPKADVTANGERVLLVKGWLLAGGLVFFLVVETEKFVIRSSDSLRSVGGSWYAGRCDDSELIASSTSQQHWNGAAVEYAFCDAPKEETAHAARPARPDDDQVRSYRLHNRDQFAQRLAGPRLAACPPSRTAKFSRDTVQRFHVGRCPCCVDASHFLGDRRSSSGNVRCA